MSQWDAQQYLLFHDQRTQPCIDLVQHIELKSPETIIDLGCGPGNSTKVLAERWPNALVTGLDNSSEMLTEARTLHPQWRWVLGDIRTFASDRDGLKYDMVFSNAALQWLTDHARLFPQLFNRVEPGGALAVQMPAVLDSPAQYSILELIQDPRWEKHFREPLRDWFHHDLHFYYSLLAASARRVDLWQTTYLHIMSGPNDIVEWYRGTALRPYLQALPDDFTRQEFLCEYSQQIAQAYPAQPNGRVLFPFKRIFIVAYC